ncbi:hypothetical protein KQH42_28185 [Streptomyces sp. CHA1]|uniref:hypothetical protein n=1 Tax=Streptomyces TaxID=1883 RepID=UPI001BFC3E4C|nr:MULTISPECIES: hypothetical protein [unclassified Streptomyces]MBT3160144.1 hypothetical protein [Streptomyces sp. G11C]MCO6704304.1 hypothetical protein [Streptomyces sp. CHB9.2]MCO6710574.1 hypothetical protein [Streptomyces sp. CHA3]MCO6716374.1 hypothetical protein [Streptomyces sp. CHB19.2]MCO6722505.1 hypothetical protein [Streptomyces sp. Vc714c-19]
MTTNRVPLPRAELADLLTDAAQSVSGILTAKYPTAASRSYLHPVLGALSAGPGVVAELNDRLEELLAEAPPANPAGLFTLASYASALGWLAESFAELTTTVDQIYTRVGIPTDPPEPATWPDHVQPVGGVAISALDLVAIRSAAEAADLAPDVYVEALSESLLAASRITDACMEISSGLLEDATYVLDEAADHVSIGDGPNSLPTLVRSLLARMQAAE